MLLPLTLSMGASIDLGRAHLARAKLRSIADGAALAAATTATKDQAKMTFVAKGYVESANVVAEQANIAEIKVTFPKDDTVRVEIVGSIDTAFMRIVGQDVVDLNVVAEAVRGTSAALEVSFALDVTGSMSGAKITTLKKAASDLIDTLEEDPEADVKYALVPFNSHVNVGMSRRNAPWINVPPDDTVARNECRMVTPVIRESNCVTKDTVQISDGVSRTVRVRQCDQVFGTPTEVCTPYFNRWFGCVGSRPAPLNASDSNPGTRYPGLLTRTTVCAQEITPLTDNVTTIKSAINALTVSGDTYIPAGLLWAWNMLSPGAPFEEAKPYDSDNRNPRKVLILMTDGNNTRSQQGTGHWGTDGAAANALTSSLCANVKAAKIEVITVAFSVTDVATKTMLQACASSPGNYYEASDNAALLLTFEEIAQSLKSIRIQS